MAEDVAENWEALDDVNELDKQLKKLEDSVKNSMNDDELRQPKSNNNRVSSDPTVTLYNKPAFRILKRDTSQGQSSLSSTSSSSSKPVRSLEEREAAYAEARLRILGSAEEGGLRSEIIASDNPSSATNCSSQRKSPLEKSSVQKSKGVCNNR